MIVTFIGAGSIGFTRRLIADLLSVPEFRHVTLRLQDISQRNLGMVAQLVRKDLAANQHPARLETTTDQAVALRDAGYVFNTARVGGLDGFQHDVNIPLTYGIDQCVGDTICAGGIMYAQRGIPMILKLCEDIHEHAAPDCRLLNYANPMAMMTWAANTTGGVDTIGLCHGVQDGRRLIAKVFQLSSEEVDIVCAGINHQTWYIDIRHRGKDLGGQLLAALEAHPFFRHQEKVRIDILRRFGHFSTESNGHLSEYLAWYRKRPDEVKQWMGDHSWINGETAGYLRNCIEGRNWFDTVFPKWLRGPARSFVAERRSEEHGSYIIESMETGRTYHGHFNRVNDDTISNLPADAIVEAPGHVDGNGLHMTTGLALPLGCAAICKQSIEVQRLAVAAAVAGDDQLLRQAMLLDPLVGAVCTPPEVWQMVDEMLVAQARWLPQYKQAIVAAEKRLNTGKTIQTRDYRGAARKPVASLASMQRRAADLEQNTPPHDESRPDRDT